MVFTNTPNAGWALYEWILRQKVKDHKGIVAKNRTVQAAYDI